MHLSQTLRSSQIADGFELRVGDKPAVSAATIRIDELSVL